MLHSPKHKAIVPFALLVGGVAVLCDDVLWKGRVLSGPDMVNYFVPVAHFARDWLSSGVLPLWNPMTFCGWPQVGDPQLRWLYPPNMLLFLIDPEAAFSLLVVVNIAFAAVGMWLYLRKAAGVGPWPSLVGAATFALSGFFANHLMSGIIVFPATSAWVPWILLLGWKLGQPQVSVATVGLFGAAIGGQVLSGSPQIVFCTWIALILQALWLIIARATSTPGCSSGWPDKMRPWLAIVRRYVAGAALGIALGASSLIPSSEFASLSFQRGEKASWEAATSCSLAPRYFWLIVAPRFFSDPKIEAIYWGGQEGYWDISGYVGIGPLAAVLVALLSWPALFQSRARQQTAGRGRSAECTRQTRAPAMSSGAFAFFHIALAALGVFFALGGHNPAYRFFYERVPGFDLFRVPARWLLFWQFGLATIFALVLDRAAAARTDTDDRSLGLAARTDTDNLADTDGRLAVNRVAIAAVVVLVVCLVLALRFTPAMMDATGVLPPADANISELRRGYARGSLYRATAFAFGWLIFFTAARFQKINPLADARGSAPLARQVLPFLAALLVLADVLTYGTSISTTSTRSELAEQFFRQSPLIEFLTSEIGGHRTLAADDVHYYWNDQNQPELWANRAMVAGLRDARGYYPLCLRWFGQFVNAMCQRPARFDVTGLLSVEPRAKRLNVALLSMLDVRFLLSYDDLALEGGRVVHRTDFGLNIYSVPTRGPTFLAKAQSSAGMSEESELALLADPHFDTWHVALVRNQIYEGSEPRTSVSGQEKLATTMLGEVRLSRPSPNEIELSVEAGEDGVVVISEAYHPGWKARLNGQPVAVVRANHALIGVCVPAGRHDVALTFSPSSFRIGFYFSLVAAGILAGLVIVAMRGQPGRLRIARLP